MGILIDNRPTLGSAPGLHVLLAGVSAYPHLPGGDGPTAPKPFGMKQLSCAALSILRLYEWIVARQACFPVPLATVRVVCSPSSKEIAVAPQLANFGLRARRADFVSDVKAWRKDARGNQQNMTLFYFAGHGVQRKLDDAVLLLEDFADPADGPLSKTATIDHIFNGMAPPPGGTVANRQLYFVDCCRIEPDEFRDLEWMNVPDVWDVELGGVDDRHAPVFYAGIPGSKVYGRPAQQTLFNDALLRCLDGLGADATEDNSGNVEWVVDVHSLNAALVDQINALNNLHRTDQVVALSGLVRNMPIHRLDAAPKVPVQLFVNPSTLSHLVRARLRQPNDNQQVWVADPFDPHPYEGEVSAGLYEFNAELLNPDPQYRDYSRIRQVKPPRFTWEARLS